MIVRVNDKPAICEHWTLMLFVGCMYVGVNFSVLVWIDRHPLENGCHVTLLLSIYHYFFEIVTRVIMGTFFLYDIIYIIQEKNESKWDKFIVRWYYIRMCFEVYYTYMLYHWHFDVVIAICVVRWIWET